MKKTKGEIARQNRQRGKRDEKETAKAFEGKRIGVLGKEDVEHPLFSIESKSRKSFVAKKWMEQAENNCPEGKIALVKCHVLNQKREKDLVIVKLKDFLKIIKKG